MNNNTLVKSIRFALESGVINQAEAIDALESILLGSSKSTPNTNSGCSCNKNRNTLSVRGGGCGGTRGGGCGR